MKEIAESLADFYKELKKRGMPEARAYDLTRTQLIVMIQRSVGNKPTSAEISKTIEKMLGLDKKDPKE